MQPVATAAGLRVETQWAELTSLGIATIPDYAGDGKQLARSADRALYAAKTNRRNRTETAALVTQRDPDALELLSTARHDQLR